MAVKQRRAEPTAKERQVADRVQRATKSYAKWDRHGGYLDACRDLARETGADPESVYSEWEFEATQRLYNGTIEIEDAEIDALKEIQRRFRLAS